MTNPTIYALLTAALMTAPAAAQDAKLNGQQQDHQEYTGSIDAKADKVPDDPKVGEKDAGTDSQDNNNDDARLNGQLEDYHEYTGPIDAKHTEKQEDDPKGSEQEARQADESSDADQKQNEQALPESPFGSWQGLAFLEMEHDKKNLTARLHADSAGEWLGLVLLSLNSNQQQIFRDVPPLLSEGTVLGVQMSDTSSIEFVISHEPLPSAIKVWGQGIAVNADGLWTSGLVQTLIQ